MRRVTLHSWNGPEPLATLWQLPDEYRATLPWVELAAEELLTNIYKYSYAEGQGKTVVECGPATWDGQPVLLLRITDWGTAFNPFSEAPLPDIMASCAVRHVGGLGVYLVKNTSAHQRYTREEDANVVELCFALLPLV